MSCFVRLGQKLLERVGTTYSGFTYYDIVPIDRERHLYLDDHKVLSPIPRNFKYVLTDLQLEDVKEDQVIPEDQTPEDVRSVFQDRRVVHLDAKRVALLPSGASTDIGMTSVTIQTQKSNLLRSHPAMIEFFSNPEHDFHVKRPTMEDMSFSIRKLGSNSKAEQTKAKNFVSVHRYFTKIWEQMPKFYRRKKKPTKNHQCAWCGERRTLRFKSRVRLEDKDEDKVRVKIGSDCYMKYRALQIYIGVVHNMERLVWTYALRDDEVDQVQTAIDDMVDACIMVRAKYGMDPKFITEDSDPSDSDDDSEDDEMDYQVLEDSSSESEDEVSGSDSEYILSQDSSDSWVTAAASDVSRDSWVTAASDVSQGDVDSDSDSASDMSPPMDEESDEEEEEIVVVKRRRRVD